MKTIMNKILNWFKALIALFISAISKGVDFIVVETKKAKDLATKIIDTRVNARDDDIQFQIEHPVEWRTRKNVEEYEKATNLIRRGTIGVGIGVGGIGISGAMIIAGKILMP